MEHVTPARAATDPENATSTSQTGTPIPKSGRSNGSQDSKVAQPDDRPPRTHLSTPKHNFELLASRVVSQAISEEACTSKLPASPLDSISTSRYPRLPRFPITTEGSHPVLCNDEVTSTKISLDEEGMVGTKTSSSTRYTKSSKRKNLRTALHRAVSTPTLGLKRINSRIRRASTILLSRTSPNRPSQSISDRQAAVRSTCYHYIT